MPPCAILKELSRQSSGESGPKILRQVSGNLPGELGELDRMLASAAREFSTQVRNDLAQLLARRADKFSLLAEELVLDEIGVAEPILRYAPALKESTLLKVVDRKSHQHMMLVSIRPDVTISVSQALLESGDDAVVYSLLENQHASIALSTYHAILARADRNAKLNAPLVRRIGIPLEILSDLYMKVGASLRQEILGRFGKVPESELTAAFKGRARTIGKYKQVAGDFEVARRRVRELARRGKLLSRVLVILLREGSPSRTTFVVAFSELADIDYGVMQWIIDGPDLEALALVCRGAGFERALFTALAIGLDKSEKGLSQAVQYGLLFETVPAQAAERTMRFWKLRSSALLA